MTYKTHIAFASMITLYPIYLLQTQNLITDAELPTFLGSLALGAVAPDIDHTRSYISKRVPILPYILAFYTKHRGFTHSLLGVLTIALLLYLLHFFIHIHSLQLIAFLFGYLLHIAGDALTLSGIKNFCCNKTLYLFPKSLRFKTGSFKEWFFFTLFSSFAGYEYLLFFDQAHMPNLPHLLHQTLHTINLLL